MFRFASFSMLLWFQNHCRITFSSLQRETLPLHHCVHGVGGVKRRVLALPGTQSSALPLLEVHLSHGTWEIILLGQDKSFSEIVELSRCESTLNEYQSDLITLEFILSPP